MKYTARVKKWDDGWEVHVDGVGVTQTRTLDKARKQAADLVNSYETDAQATANDIELITDLGTLSDAVTKARQMVRDAERLQSQAAAESRRVARSLRQQGLSVSDAATVLGVSRGRVSQLVRNPTPTVGKSPAVRVTATRATSR